MLIGERHVVPGTTYDRGFRATGLTAEGLYSELTRLVPWLPRLYARGRQGLPLTPHVVYDRWHKQHYETKKGPKRSRTVGQGKEHARNDKRLLQLLEYVDVLFKRNTPISQAEVARACAKAGLPFGRIP